jgi:hypothetical protein
MPINTCNQHNEYEAFSGGTATPHPQYINSDGEAVIQCGTVKLGNGGVFN